LIKSDSKDIFNNTSVIPFKKKICLEFCIQQSWKNVSRFRT